MHKQTKATKIPMEVKLEVGRRDNWSCIICQRPGLPEAHYIRRSQGGLGIEQNIVTLCRECHERFDIVTIVWSLWTWWRNNNMTRAAVAGQITTNTEKELSRKK